jgi:hypothetical protein
MLAIILSRIRFSLAGLMMLAFLGALTSCVTKDPAPLIADPSATRETALPWNQQQKWEREGEASAMNQQRR